MSMFSKFSLRTKILLVCWSFLLPVVYLLMATVGAYDKDINFAKTEKSGILWMRTNISLMRGVIRFDELSMRANTGDKEAAEKLSDVASSVADDFDALRKLYTEYSTVLKVTQSDLDQRGRGNFSVDNLYKEWERARSSTSVTDGADLRTALITHIRGLLSHVGDTSNLVLDPDLDSYYLMDMLVVALPQGMERLAHVDDHFADVTESNKRNDSMVGPVYAAMITEADAGRIDGDFSTARTEDGNFHGVNDIVQNKLPAVLAGMKTTAQRLTEYLNKPREPKDMQSAVVQLGDLGSAYLTIWNMSADAIDGMFDARISDYQTQKNIATAVSAALVVVMMVMSFFVIGRISKSIETLVSAVARDASSLASISDKLDSSVQSAAMASTQQSASIEETVSSMEEMGSMIALTTQDAAKTKSDAEDGLQETDRGRAVVSEMVNSMHDISSANDRLQGIVKVINDITDKTKVINDIAFETRLLAFNASIEAARAGAHGRGFAVVAEEVGKLANVSSKAADEVRGLLETSISQVTGVLSETKSTVERGQKTSSACSDAFARVNETMKNVGLAIDRIAAAAKEQLTGVKQTNAAMQEMEKVSQQSVRTGENLASESAKLRATASNLQDSAATMYAIVSGSKGGKASQQKVSLHVDDTKFKSGTGGGTKKRDHQNRAKPVRFSEQAKIKQPKVEEGTADHQGASEAKTAAEPPEAKLNRNDSRWNAA